MITENIGVSQMKLIADDKADGGCEKKEEKKSLGTQKESTTNSVIGKTYGKLLIIDELEPHITPNGSKQRIVKCQCACGNVFDIRLTSARKNGKCTRCRYKDHRADLTGKRFGKLVVISMADDYLSPSGHRLARCRCLCDCGNTCDVNMSALVTGATRSCGCINNSRGLLKSDASVMQKFDYERNQNVDLETLTTCSNEKVWWKCDKCGHSWLAVVSSQTDKKKHHGCPYCSGRLVIKGQTDLASQKPELLDEWDYDKNIFLPNEVSCYSGKKAWWKCAECGYCWKSTIANRVNGSGCPKCNIENVNSFCEQAVYYYIKKAFPDAINSDQHIGMELDIYIPSRSVAIEYDGEAWHRTEKKRQIDERKNQLCRQAGITLIRIREPKLETIENCIVFKRLDSTTEKSLSGVILEVLSYLGIQNIVVDVDRDNIKILEQFASKKFDNSLSYCYPELVKEWHPTKNGELTPDKVSKSTSKQVWWLGKCGHEWETPLKQRSIDNSQCPICFNERRSPAVICIETGKLFQNGIEAAAFAGLKGTSTIYKCCKGKCGTAGGYHWKYKDMQD